MPNTPQPGRIATPQPLKGKIPDASTNAARVSTSTKNPEQASMSRVTSSVSARAGESESQTKLNKALKLAHATGRVPSSPSYRISLFEGGFFIGISAFVDIVDWIAGLFFEVAIGEIIVVIVDVIYGIMVACYCKFRLKLGFSSHLNIYISILGAEVINFIPFVNVAWWLDAWYIVKTIRAEDKAVFDELIQILQQEEAEKQRQEWVENYEMQQQQAAQAENSEVVESQSEETEEGGGSEGEEAPEGPGRFKTNKPQTSNAQPMTQNEWKQKPLAQPNPTPPKKVV